MPRKRTARLYWREQGGRRRAYGDFRDLGGGREALVADGERLATTDPVIAEALIAKRLGELQESRRDRVLLGVRRRATLEPYAAEHLVKKAQSGRVSRDHLESLEDQMRAAVEYFGDRELSTIFVEDIQGYATWLASRPNGRGGTLSTTTQRHYLDALSNLFRRAQGEGIIRTLNPVEALMDKPVPQRGEAPWLEVWEASLLLEAARLYPTERRTSTAGERLGAAIAEGWGADGMERFVARMREAGMLASAESLRAYVAGERIPTRVYLEAAARVLEISPDRLVKPRGWNNGEQAVAKEFYPLVATFLLLGGRQAEVLGLELGDVDVKRGIVRIRPTERRRVKTRSSWRTVPLWPQLREILEPHLQRRREAGAGERDLVFASWRTGGMLTDIRKPLDQVARAAGWRPGDIRTKMFRHTYCAARLQTIDRGYPVSAYTVAKELGHGGDNLVKQVYGHLGQIRHRSECVEYRVEQQRDEIPADRLRLLLRAV